MARYGKYYRSMYDMQQSLLETITSKTADGSEKASCARAWLELEWARREMRGIPRIKAIEWSELMNYRKQPKAITNATACVEASFDIETTKTPSPPAQDASQVKPATKDKESI